MKNGNDIIEIKNPKVEEVIRKERRKPTGPLTWGDFRFCKSYIKLLANGSIGLGRIEYNPNYGKLDAAVQEKMREQENSDNYAGKLYTNMHAAQLKYRSVFGLGMILGATEFWDIGCGMEMQAGLAAVYKGIRYTGIDCMTERVRMHTIMTPEGTVKQWTESIPFTVEEYNEIFSSYGGIIRFRNDTYPCPVDPGKHSIAICIGWDFGDPQGFGNALTADFDRVILQYSLEKEEEWKNALSDFTLQPLYGWNRTNYFTGKVLGGWRVVLATKCPEDTDYLQSIGYDWYNTRFQLGSFDLSKYLDRFHKNVEIGKEHT